MSNALRLEDSKFTTRFLLWGLPLAYLCIVVTFYLHTYDSAQVKITVAQMGLSALLGIWLMEKIEDGHLGLSREYLPVYLPFFAFLISGIFSFIVLAPFKWISLDDFIRRVLYMSVSIMLFDRLRSLQVTERILKILIWTLFIACFYAFLQFLDSRFFPPGPETIGADIFVWRQAFGTRVFSTFGNPNFFADYLVLMVPIILSWAICKKSFPAWCLLGLTLFNIVLTETKGAWLGLAVTLYVWINLYGLFIPGSIAEFVKRRLVSALVTFIVAFTLIVGMSPYLNVHSIPFRVFTWLSTFEMIKTHPVIGTGIGSFKVVYSAFRRPHIFHLEDKHNTETDHSENEHLEVLFDEGIVGFGIYIWLIFTVTYLSAKALNRWKKYSLKEEPRSHYLIGVLAGWLGMLAHNNFDVSMRFVSSGIYMGLLPALAVSIALSDRIWRQLPEPSAPGSVSAAPRWRAVLLTIAKLLAVAAIAFVVVNVLRGFYPIQTLHLMDHPGNNVMLALAWIFFIALMGGGVFAYVRTVWSTKSLWACFVPVALAYPMLFFWGWFSGDVHHNLGIVDSKNRNWKGAIANYTEVTRLNPGYAMAYYFLGNVFNDRFDMAKQNVPEWGDPPGVARTDFDRALGVYELIRTKLAPNYVQMHFHVGNLFLRRAEWGKSNGDSPEKTKELYEEAVRRYRLYEMIDPVFPENYYRLAFALSRLGRYRDAEEELKKRILALPCAGHGHFGMYYTHLYPEDFMQLANTYLIAGDYKRAVATYKDYLKHINPGQPQIESNLNMLLTHREAIMQQMRALAPANVPAASFQVEHPVRK